MVFSLNPDLGKISKVKQTSFKPGVGLINDDEFRPLRQHFSHLSTMISEMASHPSGLFVLTGSKSQMFVSKNLSFRFVSAKLKKQK